MTTLFSFHNSSKVYTFKKCFQLASITFEIIKLQEGNGNPLRYSCLENPRDGGAWWAAAYGVAQSRTQLKRLSSSNKNTDSKKYFSLNEVFKIGQSHSFRNNLF